MVMTAPPRYDLIPSSCVNNEVVRFNRQLKKSMRMYNNVKILENDIEKEYFTYCSDTGCSWQNFFQQEESVSPYDLISR